ncbi:radical SAM protein [Desulfogranum mediterraneum]|uniref:radical SAM protein n=1 Tax=Desulfogranum mediterraneum TaxID=160661 RepID=UPI000427D740|nr:radical SAM protein [Desulfogranum mediterraneum]
MKHLFGPVNSRRLGRSLGIDFYTEKTCNLNCVYCEVGLSAVLYQERQEYTPTEDIIAEIEQLSQDREQLDRIDVITVTGSGEPTLHSGLGAVIQALRQRIQKPIVVLTNSTLLMRKDVQEELMGADRVVPSMDAARQRTFNRVDRPAPGIHTEEIIAGLETFSHTFSGELWLEILLVQGINDAPDDVEALINALRPLRLDRIQLNTIFRPAPESFAHPLTPAELKAIGARLSAELAVPLDLPAPARQVEAPLDEIQPSPQSRQAADCVEDIIQMIKRRPCTAADINRTFQLGGAKIIEQLLEPLVQTGAIQKYRHENSTFYQ